MQACGWLSCLLTLLFPELNDYTYLVKGIVLIRVEISRVRWVLSTICLTGSMLAASPANAALEQRVVQGLTPSTTVTAVYDSATRLEWLAPDATVGMGFNAVLTSDYVTRGYRYATGAELVQLVVDAGFDQSINRLATIVPHWENVSGRNLDVIKTVVGLLGPSSSPKWFSSTSYTMVYARLGDIDPNVDPQYADFAHTAALLYAEESSGRFFVGGAGLGSVGNYLVREVSAVPEAGTAAMLAIGLLAFAMRKHRQ